MNRCNYLVLVAFNLKNPCNYLILVTFAFLPILKNWFLVESAIFFNSCYKLLQFNFHDEDFTVLRVCRFLTYWIICLTVVKLSTPKNGHLLITKKTELIMELFIFMAGGVLLYRVAKKTETDTAFSNFN